MRMRRLTSGRKKHFDTMVKMDIPAKTNNQQVAKEIFIESKTMVKNRKRTQQPLTPLIMTITQATSHRTKKTTSATTTTTIHQNNHKTIRRKKELKNYLTSSKSIYKSANDDDHSNIHHNNKIISNNNKRRIIKHKYYCFNTSRVSSIVLLMSFIYFSCHLMQNCCQISGAQQVTGDEKQENKPMILPTVIVRGFLVSIYTFSLFLSFNSK